jgi:uncharacterized protein (TIGR02271 family)
LTHLHLDSHLKPISELGGYKVEEGDPDPRGWSVLAPDGHRIGEVEDLIVDTNAMKVRHLVIDLDEDAVRNRGEDETVLLNVEDVDVRDARREVVARTFGAEGFGSTGRAHAYSRQATDERDRATITRAEEEVHIGKREVSRGEARIGKHVETERVSEPVTRRREEVVVERRPVDAGARADASISEDEISIPLKEEEVLVEKRPVVKEELVVGKRVVEDKDVVETDVRREEFDIDERADKTSTDTTGRRRDR